MTIPIEIDKMLTDRNLMRSEDKTFEKAVLDLGLIGDGDFVAFYRKFRGPFYSQITGYELLDFHEQDESVITSTLAVREEFEFPDQYLVVSTMLANGVLVYDTMTGYVYDVDFEGGDELLLTGHLPARWKSWGEFISEYFLPRQGSRPPRA